MPEGPSESIQVDENDTDNTASGSASDIAIGSGRGRETDVEGQVEHGSGLDRCSDEERQTPSDAASRCESRDPTQVFLM